MTARWVTPSATCPRGRSPPVGTALGEPCHPTKPAAPRTGGDGSGLEPYSISTKHQHSHNIILKQSWSSMTAPWGHHSYCPRKDLPTHPTPAPNSSYCLLHPLKLSRVTRHPPRAPRPPCGSAPWSQHTLERHRIEQGGSWHGAGFPCQRSPRAGAAAGLIPRKHREVLPTWIAPDSALKN